MYKPMMNLMSCLMTMAVFSLMFAGCVAHAQEKANQDEAKSTSAPATSSAATSTAKSTTATPTVKTTAPVAEKTIAETLKSLPECSQFVQNAEKCGVFKEFSEKEPLTVLVPVNSAYNAMSTELRNEIKNSERKEKAVCRFHILKGDISLEELKTSEEIETWCNEDGTCTMNFTEITKPSKDVIRKEINCNNGRIYLINEVLIPECCRKGFLERTGDTIGEGAKKVGHAVNEGADTVGKNLKDTGEWIGEGVKHTGEAIGEGAKDLYEGSRTVIGHGLESASHGLQKASDYVTPSQSPSQPVKK